MVVRKGMVGVLAAIGAAMLFVVSAAGAMYGGYDLNDTAVAGDATGAGGLDTVISDSLAPVADNSVEGYVLDNATGEGIAGAIVAFVHIPDDVSRDDVNTYVNNVLSVLRQAREKLGDRREKLEKLTDEAQEKLEKASERLEQANGNLCENKERLQDAIDAALDRPGGAGRPAMKRIEKATQKLAAEEKMLGQMQVKVDDDAAQAKDRLRDMRQDLQNDTEMIRDGLAGRGICIVRTDEEGGYSANAADGSTVVVALAPGYIQGRKGVELPASERGAVTLRLDEKPRADVYRVRFVWGYLDEVNREGQFAAWNGSISVSDGAVRLVRVVQFEHGGKFARGGNDKAYAQTGKDTISWRSSTTVARDGVVVDIIVPAGSDGAKVTLTAGEWSKTVALERLEGQKIRISIGEAGHEVLVACELLGQPVM